MRNASLLLQDRQGAQQHANRVSSTNSVLGHPEVLREVDVRLPGSLRRHRHQIHGFVVEG